MKAIFRSMKDSRIFLLIFPATFVLWLLDPILTETWCQWGLAMLAVAGLTLLLRKILFNTFDMSAAIEKAVESSAGAGQVVMAVAIVMASIMLSVTLWLSR
jgi:hypothetical protein